MRFCQIARQHRRGLAVQACLPPSADVEPWRRPTVSPTERGHRLLALPKRRELLPVSSTVVAAVLDRRLAVQFAEAEWPRLTDLEGLPHVRTRGYHHRLLAGGAGDSPGSPLRLCWAPSLGFRTCTKSKVSGRV